MLRNYQRRWQAAQSAGLHEVPVVILNVDDVISDKTYLKTMLKSEIAGARWGINELWGIRVNADNQLIESMKHFDKAGSFLDNYQYN